MNVKSIVFLASLVVLTACGTPQSGPTIMEETDSSVVVEPMDTSAYVFDSTRTPGLADPDPTDSIPPTGYDPASSNMVIAAMIRLALQNDILKKDLAAIPPEQRRFKYHGFDINNDGRLEFFVTITGPYFCGTGGCTVFLLDHDFHKINSFTVVDFPIYVAAGKSHGFQDLIIKSGGKLHYVKMGSGKKYPSNPSVQPLYEGDPPSPAPQLLSIYDQPYPAFSF